MTRTNTGSRFQSRGNPAARTNLNRLPAVRRAPTSTFPTLMKAPPAEAGKVGKDGNVSAAERQEKSEIPEETIAGSTADPGKVGKDGNVSAAERREESE